MTSDLHILIQKAFNKVESLFLNNDPSHDFYHVKRVHKLALWIASDVIIFTSNSESRINSSNLDMLRLQLCAILHDVGDHKYLKEGETTIELLTNVFKEIDIPSDLHDKLIEDIISISWTYQKKTGLAPKSWEAKIVQDADRLDALGAVGISRVFSFGAVKNRPIYKPNSEVILPNFLDTKSNINEMCSLDHFMGKLFHIKDKMNTLKGYNEAEDRHSIMVYYVSQFLFELRISE